MDKFRTYLTADKSAEDRKFGYYALARLGQEAFAIELITLKRDPAGEEVLTTIATKSKDGDIREAARDGLVILRSSRPGCEALFTVVDDSGFVKFLNGWENENLKEFVVPQLARIRNGPTGGKVKFNFRAADALTGAWAELEQRGLLNRVVSWDGGYVPRKNRSADTLTSHACGLAFDINAAANPFGQPPKPAGVSGSVSELVPIFEKYGFKWGGNFKPRPDPMHFEYVVTESAAQSAPATRR